MVYGLADHVISYLTIMSSPGIRHETEPAIELNQSAARCGARYHVLVRGGQHDTTPILVSETHQRLHCSRAMALLPGVGDDGIQPDVTAFGDVQMEFGQIVRCFDALSELMQDIGGECLHSRQSSGDATHG